MNICYILETKNPPRPNEIIVETAELLKSRGANVSMVHPEQELWRLDTLCVEADLYLLKSDSELALSLAHSLELLGANVVNTFDTCKTLKDKTLTAGLLHHSGISTPRSYAAGEAAQFSTLLQHKPVILKPNRGYHGAGIAVFDKLSTASDLPDYPDMVFAQNYISNGRKDLKIFGIAEQVFALRKPFTTDSFKLSGKPTELKQEYEMIAHQCRDLFNLELYGIDLVELDDEVYVVDVNYFPGYRGVDNAAQYLTDFIWKTANNNL